MRKKSARSALVAIGCTLIGFMISSCRLNADVEKTEDGEWKSLFDGESLEGWEITPFGGGDDEVWVEEGRIVLDFGAANISGITYKGPTPTMNYEVSLEARRESGFDFFCGLTFPYNDSCCSLIVGGWGGDLVGISSFDGWDAASNETTAFMNFENNRWYTIELSVSDNRIVASIDGKIIVDAQPNDRRISVREEVELSQPFGLAAWNTRAGLRNILIRSVKPE